MVNKIKEKSLKFISTATLTSYLISGGNISDMVRRMKKDTDRILSTPPKIENEIVLNTKDITTMQNYNIIRTMEVGGETINIVVDAEEASNELDIETTDMILNEDGVEEYPLEETLNLTFNTQEEMISFYSKVFQLNEDIMANKIEELINSDYTSWMNGNMLNGIAYETVEQAIARTLADISLRPEEFNLTEEAIRTEEYELSDYIPEELIYKFSEVIGVNPNIALAIAYGESGTSLSSYNFRTNYNVAGLHRRTGDPSPQTGEGYVIFRNQADGLIRFTMVLRDHFYVTSDSDINRINRMSNSYCAVPGHWRNLVGGIYCNLESNGYDYYYTTFNYQDRDLVYPETEEANQLILTN